MKKLFTLIGAILITGSVMAQKPSSDDSNYSLEGMINYNSNSGISWDAPSVRMRYFMSDQNAIRVSLSMNLNTIEFEPSTFNLGVGYERHMSGTDRMSPYLGGGIGIGSSNLNEETDFSFGANAVAGMDYYIFENIYMGLELGITISDGDAGIYNSMTRAGRFGWRF